jgi:hypothetical protein
VAKLRLLAQLAHLRVKEREFVFEEKALLKLNWFIFDCVMQYQESHGANVNAKDGTFFLTVL